MVNMSQGHATNSAGNDNIMKFTLYDNTAGSGTIIGIFMLPASTSLEMDFHGAQLDKGIYAAIDTDPHGATAATGGITVNFV